MAKNVSEGRFWGLIFQNFPGEDSETPQLVINSACIYKQFIFVECEGRDYYLVCLFGAPPPSGPCDHDFSVGSDKFLRASMDIIEFSYEETEILKRDF